MDNAGKKILIVEDDQFLREFYQELLQEEGYIVDVAADGEIALKKITEGGFSLVLLDIMLPKMDGINILKTLRSSNSCTFANTIEGIFDTKNNTCTKKGF